MGEARRKRLAGRVPQREAPVSASRSPEEVEAQLAADQRFYARIDAAIDFIHATSEDALGQQVRRAILS
jgi:hypothetical protein